MSQYTSLHIVPMNDVDWMPDNDLILEILEHVGCTGFWYLSGYSVSLYWDREDFYDYKVFSDSDVSVDEAMSVLSKQNVIVTSAGLSCESFSDKLNNSTITIPKALSDGLSLYDVSMTLGPFSIPSLDHETTIGRYCFQIKLGGSGMPNNPPAYFELVRKNLVVLEILNFLEKRTGKEWTTLMSCYY